MIQGNMAGGNEDLLYVHWGYLNVLQLCDSTGKKLKRYGWRTFWTDLCGSTLRLYEDTSLLSSKKNIPPITLIEPRPEDKIKHAFFCLNHATVKDFDSNKYFENLNVPRLSRKNTFQIILLDSSAYLLQAPSMAALYRWLTKIQSSIDNAEEKLYDKQLLDAKMLMYERRRYCDSRKPTYPEPPKTDSEEEEPCDPRIQKLKETLREKERLLYQLERQEKDFLGTDDVNEGTIARIEFAATAKIDYFLVPGRPETLIPAGKTFTVFGLLPNGRWRCFAETDAADRGSAPGRIPAVNTPDTCEGSGEGVDIDDATTYPCPLIGSVPTSAILELTQPSQIKDMVDNMSVSSSSDVSIPGTPPLGTPPPDTPPLDTPSSPFWSTTDPSPEPYSSHRPPSRSVATGQSSTAAALRSPPAPSSLPPFNPPPTGNLGRAMTRAALNSDSSTLSESSRSLPNTPTSPCEASIVGDLNQALESLSMLAARTRLSSGVSSCSGNSASSQEDYSSSDMYRGSLLLPSDDNCSFVEPNTVGTVRMRKRRDIHITKKLHARGISLVVGSSSSSEDEDESEPRNKGNNKRHDERGKDSPSRKIEELHASKEKLTDKVLKGTKSASETTSKPPSTDRGNLLDNPTLNHDLLREFSDNSYGLPTRNSVTQEQFKPLASHEIPPPLHQRRTLQMTRKENEGFGFVLQTHTVVEVGSCADTMTFVSNVSEDGPAYLAGMRPGDIIIEIESANVEDDDKGIIVETLNNACLTVRLVVVYKDAIRRMRLVTRLMALKASLKEKETAYEALERKEQAILGRVEDPSAVEAKVKVATVYIHIQNASTTFARDSPDVKNAVTQNRRTPAELLQAKQPPLSDLSRLCGVPTKGFELVREFASRRETDARDGPAKTTLAPKYASDPTLNSTTSTTTMKKRKTSEGTSKQKTLKQCQRSSFISYVDIAVDTQNVEDSRRRIRSEGYEPESEEPRNFEGLVEKEEKPIEKAALSVQPSLIRPESYMFAVGTNSINAYPLNSLVSSGVPGHRHEHRDLEHV